MIALITSLWDRPGIEEIMLDYYAALQRPLVLVAAYSDETQKSTIKRAREMGWYLVKGPRKPLGLKLNTASRTLGASILARDVTHVITLGSDDLIHPDALDLLCVEGQLHDATGFVGAYFLDAETQRAAHFEYPPGQRHRPCGAGRIMQRHVLEKLNWAPRCDEVSRGMDSAMDQALRSVGVRWHVIDHKSTDAPVLDVKTARNLSSFQHMLNAGAVEIPPDDIYAAFGDPWASRLRALEAAPPAFMERDDVRRVLDILGQES